MTQDHTETPRRKSSSVIITVLASALMIAVLGIAFAGEFDLIERSIAKRASGFVFALMLVVTGNYLPKIVLPMISAGADIARGVERFAGWSFVLAGLVALPVCLLAPIEHMLLVEAVIVLSAFALVAIKWASARPSGRASAETGAVGGVDAAIPRARLGLILILHALFWVFAIFVVDAFWGDAAAKWTLLPAMIANSALAFFAMPVLTGRRKTTD